MANFFIFTLFALIALAFTNADTYCSGRGGCSCDCSWASPSTCGVDDGSCCFGCCCQTTPPTPGNQTFALYCPQAKDFIVAYAAPNQPSLYDGGWSLNGGGAAATKAAFNIVGGYLEFDVDFSGVPVGVNANIYSISPSIAASGFQQQNYCDAQAPNGAWCVEVDYIESNGNCGGQTTLHTVAGPGNNGCTAWGCQNNYKYSRPNFHIRVQVDNNGGWTTIRDGETIAPGNLSPVPTANDDAVLRQTYSTKGAVIYSSQWTGWTPRADCGSGGNLAQSQLKVTNLKIYGAVTQGPTPSTC